MHQQVDNWGCETTTNIITSLSHINKSIWCKDKYSLFWLNMIVGYVWNNCSQFIEVWQWSNVKLKILEKGDKNLVHDQFKALKKKWLNLILLSN